ncbi:MAG: hypothetical protein GXO33_06615 [Epsilonproteobacteria bacterium]|nr:hypothetical protein [Campylobacterota bacterium]
MRRWLFLYIWLVLSAFGGWHWSDEWGWEDGGRCRYPSVYVVEIEGEGLSWMERRRFLEGLRRAARREGFGLSYDAGVLMRVKIKGLDRVTRRLKRKSSERWRVKARVKAAFFLIRADSGFHLYDGEIDYRFDHELYGPESRREAEETARRKTVYSLGERVGKDVGKWLRR